jgi:hypothetical protein
MKLFENEKIITSSNDDILILTNIRLRYIDKQLGKSNVSSIFLNKISFIGLKYLSNIYLLLGSIVSFIIGIVTGINGDWEFIGIGFIVGVILIITYFLTKKCYIKIVSDGGAEINFHTESMKQEAVLNFIDDLEKAIKINRDNFSQTGVRM